MRLPSRLNMKLSTLASVVASCDAAPTRQSYDVWTRLSEAADSELAALEALLAGDAAALSERIASDVPPVTLD